MTLEVILGKLIILLLTIGITEDFNSFVSNIKLMEGYVKSILTFLIFVFTMTNVNAYVTCDGDILPIQ